MTLHYRGLELPDSLFDPRIQTTMTGQGSMDLLKAQVHYLNGIDLAQGVPVVQTKPEPTPYRYFHDGDEPGIRYYRRVARGATVSTGEIYRETCPNEGWDPGHHERTLRDLADGWVEVEFHELPTEVQNAN